MACLIMFSFSMSFIACNGFEDIFLTVSIMFSKGSKAYISTSLVKSRVIVISITQTNRVRPTLSCDEKID